MNEIVIREALVFGGAVAGAVWGYFFGKIVERRRWVVEVSPSLEALERWALRVCQDLEGLELSLTRMGLVHLSETLVRNPAETTDVLAEAKVRMLSIKAAGGHGLRRVISR
jgi:hypothetical protein